MKLIYKYPQTISIKFGKDSSTRTGVITNNLFSLRKWGNTQSDRYTRNLKLFGTNVQTPQEYIHEIWETYLIMNFAFGSSFLRFKENCHTPNHLHSTSGLVVGIIIVRSLLLYFNVGRRIANHSPDGMGWVSFGLALLIKATLDQVVWVVLGWIG